MALNGINLSCIAQAIAGKLDAQDGEKDNLVEVSLWNKVFASNLPGMTIGKAKEGGGNKQGFKLNTAAKLIENWLQKDTEAKLEQLKSFCGNILKCDLETACDEQNVKHLQDVANLVKTAPRSIYEDRGMGGHFSFMNRESGEDLQIYGQSFYDDNGNVTETTYRINGKEYKKGDKYYETINQYVNQIEKNMSKDY